MVSIEVFNKLKDEYGKVASWAIWSEVGKTPKSNIGELSIFDDPNLLDKLNTDYVFVGINMSKHNDKIDSDNIEIPTWSAFHSSDLKKGQDYKIRYALEGTPCWGSYMTDLIKGVEETDSSEVEKMMYIGKHQTTEFLNSNIDEFKKELKIIESAQQNKPVLLALGGIVERTLDMFLTPEGYTVIGLTHYSDYISKENLKKGYDEKLKKYYK